MKKIYFTIIVISATVASVLAQVPTCSLNPTFIASNKIGVWPDSATNFISGTVGVPYVQNLTVKVPKDTVQSNIRFCFNRFELTSVTANNYNLPPGLNLGSSTNSVATGSVVNGAPVFVFPGNSANCASIYGTPTVAGTYTLQLKVQPFLSLAGGTGMGTCPSTPNTSGGSSSIAAPQTLNYYIINIAPAITTGLRNIGKDKMTLLQNEPNPFSDFTEVKFYVEGEDNATLTIYNALGSVVNQQTIKTSVGENKLMINAAEMANGTYIYSLKYKNAITTKRMMVINN
ncbi:MAG: T9SS type A sorting domain-containing protein [Bacteroidota bacterium]